MAKYPLLRICSGQNWKPGGNQWAVCLLDTDACPWWRAEDKAGRTRKLETLEAAERLRVRLEERLNAIGFDAPKPQPPYWDSERSAFGHALNAALRY